MNLPLTFSMYFISSNSFASILSPANLSCFTMLAVLTIVLLSPAGGNLLSGVVRISLNLGFFCTIYKIRCWEYLLLTKWFGRLTQASFQALHQPLVLAD